MWIQATKILKSWRQDHPTESPGSPSEKSIRSPSFDLSPAGYMYRCPRDDDPKILQDTGWNKARTNHQPTRV